jgi:hypothetical protein
MEPTFEDILADPYSQLDPGGELLPHLIAFGPVTGVRPWLFDAAAVTTVAYPPAEEGGAVDRL